MSVVRWTMCRKETKKKQTNRQRIDTYLIPKAVKKPKTNNEGWTGRDERDKGGAHGRRTRARDSHQNGGVMRSVGDVSTWLFFGVGVCFVERGRSSEMSGEVC